MIDVAVRQNIIWPYIYWKFNSPYVHIPESDLYFQCTILKRQKSLLTEIKAYHTIYTLYVKEFLE